MRFGKGIMSRIGKKPIKIEEGISVEISSDKVVVSSGSFVESVK